MASNLSDSINSLESNDHYENLLFEARQDSFKVYV